MGAVPRTPDSDTGTSGAAEALVISSPGGSALAQPDVLPCGLFHPSEVSGFLLST